MSQQFHELNEQLSEARAGLVAALAEGADTTPARQRISDLEARIADLERQARADSAAARRAEAAAVEEGAAALAAETHATVDAATEIPGLAELAGEPLPAVEEDPALTAAAREVARCRAALLSSEAALKPLAEQARMLSGRLSEKQGAISAIKARRLAGDERTDDAADLALLAADTEELQALVTDAHHKASAADERPAARMALNAAEQQLEQARRQGTYRKALERLKQAEAIYLEAFGVMVRAGRDAGQSSPWAAYQAGPDMRRAVTGQLIAGASNPFFK